MTNEHFDVGFMVRAAIFSVFIFLTVKVKFAADLHIYTLHTENISFLPQEANFFRVNNLIYLVYENFSKK